MKASTDRPTLARLTPAAGALAGIIGLAAASACTGLVGLAGTLVFAVFLPRRPRTAPETSAPVPRVSAVASR